MGGRLCLTGIPPNAGQPAPRRGRWEGVPPFVFLWLAPHLFVVVRCPSCLRADVSVRWPERFAFCARCGVLVFGQPAPPSADGGAEGDETP
jgi:hypothetical protein